MRKYFRGGYGSKRGVLLLLMLAAALLLLVFSGSSPLYPTNPWDDPNCFMTVAKAWSKGMLPYRDIIEQKGPLLYLLHIPAALISQSFIGVYLLEVLALTLLLYISWRTLSLFVSEKWWPLLVLAGLALVSARSFVWGDSVEELCAPLLAWSLYDALRYFSDDARALSCRRVLANGVLAGCVLWMKFSLLGLHLAWMAVIAVECVLKQKSWTRALRMCAAFLAGMAIASLPWLAYFAANGALGSLWRVYFVQNLGGYAKKSNPLMMFCVGLGGGSLVNPLMGLMSISGIVYLALKRKNTWRTIALAAMLCCTVFFIYCGGRRNGYYYFCTACFVPLGCIAIAALLEKAWSRKCAACAALACAAVLGVAFGLNRNLPSLGYPRAKLVQIRFAEQMRDAPNETMLNYGFLDGGFYRAADILPSNPWFCQLLANPQACIAEQNAIVEAGGVDYVVTRQRALEEYDVDSRHYRRMDHAVEAFNFKTRGDDYYLYRRID